MRNNIIQKQLSFKFVFTAAKRGFKGNQWGWRNVPSGKSEKDKNKEKHYEDTKNVYKNETSVHCGYRFSVGVDL